MGAQCEMCGAFVDGSLQRLRTNDLVTVEGVGLRYRGRGISPLSPDESLAEQFHTSPQLQLLRALGISRVAKLSAAKLSPGEITPPPL